jgi:adenylosuccinate synthase
MSVIAAVGMQWGDEGKGKVVDILSEFVSAVVRYAGGNNAGHTIKVGDRKIILGLLPSGVMRPGCRCILGGGMVIDPLVFLEEIGKVRALGIKAEPDRIFIARTAFAVLPIHRELDGLFEDHPGTGRIGTTRRGIGPAYQDKVGRRGLRMADIVDRDALAGKVEAIHTFWRPLFGKEGQSPPPSEETVEALWKLRGDIEPFLADTAAILHDLIRKKSNVLLEGAQGTLLDVDHGTYPFVTSSSASIAGALSGTGIGPLAITGVIGILKAYTTRVGEGPFPTEAPPDTAARLRDAGGEYGSMTGRPRRCGWLDLPALARSVRINSVSSLALTKCDVLTGFDEIPVCVGYEVNGKLTHDFPIAGLDRAVPVYEPWPGWKEDISSVREIGDLPANLRRYIQNIELKTELSVGLISVGPARNETIVVKHPFR